MFCDCFCRSYGSVYKALHKESGQVLAIKQVPVDTDLQEIIKEISIMQQCDSVFIVKYYGSYFKNTDLWVRLAVYWNLNSISQSIFQYYLHGRIIILIGYPFFWLCKKENTAWRMLMKTIECPFFFLKISKYQHELKLKHAFYMCPKN